jgi:cytochrome c oxidase subunit 3
MDFCQTLQAAQEANGSWFVVKMFAYLPIAEVQAGFGTSRPLIRTEVIYEATPETKVDAKINHDLSKFKHKSLTREE